ncbi:MAG TPA: ModE family transcriptional regulator [Methylophilaceae bacterium]|jgi:molybdate transport system regulatory protein
MSSDPLKIRISHGKITAIGPGKADLLEAIIKFGSISAAAKQMHMSYRRAWELVDTMNRCFQEPLVITASGGSHGGGASVTELGMHILKCYRDIIAKTHASAEADMQAILNSLRQAD